jgi:hypothetical protein
MMFDTLVIAMILGLLVMVALYIFGSTQGASILNLLISAVVLGLLILAITHFVKML